MKQLSKDNLKIVFFGTPEFAVASLDRLVNDGFNIAAVVTATDKPAGRGHKMLQSAVKEYAVGKGLPVLQPESLKADEFVDSLRQIDADLFIVIAFRMLPEVVWTMPPLGTFNLHGSLLPRYRGAAPINWAIINGDRETGVTTFFLKHDIDTGDIIDQERCPIAPDDDFGTVYNRLMNIGAGLTASTVQRIIDGILTTTPQDTVGLEAPSPAPKIFKDTCRIDWTAGATTVHNLVRGLSPVPAAWTTMTTDTAGPVPVKIYSTRLTGATFDGRPGETLTDKDRLSVCCGSGQLLEISELQVSGKKRMPAADWLRGQKADSIRFV